MRNQPCKELGERIFWVVGTVSAKGKSRSEFGVVEWRIEKRPLHLEHGVQVPVLNLDDCICVLRELPWESLYILNAS